MDKSIYQDNRGWKYKVRAGLSDDSFKPFYQKPGKSGWHGCRVRMNEKPKQEDTVPAVTSKQKRAGGEEMTKPKQDIKEPAQKPVSEAQESETGKCEEKKPCKISLDDIIDDVAQDLEDLKTTKMVLRKLADGAGSVEISL